MGDGAKEDPAPGKEAKFLGKAGWVKKAAGRLWASYKDCYIHVEKTEVVVYEKEDLQNCLERLDLENYDRCQELRRLFLKKHRLILIRSPKPGLKIYDVKFQTQTAEEKESWIKALGDGINRAKNKIFDEVKIDESSNLEHVTRTRPKGNRNRRPPTRIHMKEVATGSSEGILSLDFHLEDGLTSNGTYHPSVDGTEIPKEATQVPAAPSNASEATEKQSGSSSEEEAQNKPEICSQKKKIKPPMPPTKELKLIANPEDETDKDNNVSKMVLKPPMPPSKEAKPCALSAEEGTEKANDLKLSDKSPGPPPTPPQKPSFSSSMQNLLDTSDFRPNSPAPIPPPKEKKPSNVTVGGDQRPSDEIKEAPPTVSYDQPQGPDAEGQEEFKEELGDTTRCGLNKLSDTEQQTPEEQLGEHPSPPEKRSEKPVVPDTQLAEDLKPDIHLAEAEISPALLLQTVPDTSASCLQAEEVLPKSEVPSVPVNLNDISPTPDSGQNSDNDNEGSVSEDVPKAASQNHAGLDVLEGNEDKFQISVPIIHEQATIKSQTRPESFCCQRSEPISSLEPSANARSASTGDLLCDSSVCIQLRPDTTSVAGKNSVCNDLIKLEEVSLEMEKTCEILSEVSQSEKEGDKDSGPEYLLDKAMEKLNDGDHVLRETKNLKPAENSSNRKSW